jgi:hypothetical protein
MGMYDEITVKYPLPEAPLEVQGATFQTKDLECALDRYTITEAGRLIWHKVTREFVEDPESIFGFFLKPIASEDVGVDYHGDIVLYTTVDHSSERWDRTWYQYRVRFTSGTVEWARREREPWMEPGGMKEIMQRLEQERKRGTEA